MFIQVIISGVFAGRVVYMYMLGAMTLLNRNHRDKRLYFESLMNRHQWLYGKGKVGYFDATLDSHVRSTVSGFEIEFTRLD